MTIKDPHKQVTRSFRLTQGLWLTFKARCQRRGIVPSKVLRMLISYWLANERGTTLYENLPADKPNTQDKPFNCIHGVPVKGGTVCKDCKAITEGG